MTETTHSPVGASSYYRWSKCPGSVRLSKGIESPTSVYAAEGIVAHTVAAKCLLGGSRSNMPGVFAGKTIEQAGHNILVTEEMLEAIRVYLVAVKNDFASSPERPKQLVEHKFHLKTLHGSLYGTADCVHIYKEAGLLRIYDYKHGAGVAVEVEDNPQLLYYALGALLSPGVTASRVEIVVVQPRCPHPDGPVRRYTIDAVELLDFSADLLDAVRRTEDPDAPLMDGDHCRWCPASAICPKIKSRAQTIAKREFDDPNYYDPRKLADTLEWLPTLEAWCKSVREFAYAEANHGRLPLRHKLVEKRAIRKWLNEKKTIIWLRKRNLSNDEIFKHDLRSPAQIEKLFSKDKKQKVMFNKLIVSKSSGLTLVHNDDPRKAVIKDAKADFKDAE